MITEAQEQAVEQLEARMLFFYQTTRDYTAFLSGAEHELQWAEIVRHIRSNVKKSCNVLEIGAGRSNFGTYLKDQKVRHLVKYTAQDVTSSNKDFLAQTADNVIIGPISFLPKDQQYDIIFHSYVFEHITRPHIFLSTIDDLLVENGLHCIECPKYDFPFYLPNSVKHLSVYQQVALKLKDIFCHQTFSLIEDPAIFHLPFYTDRDAVHLVSEKDIRGHYQGRATISTWKVPSFGIKNWFYNHFLACRLLIIKHNG